MKPIKLIPQNKGKIESAIKAADNRAAELAVKNAAIAALTLPARIVPYSPLKYLPSQQDMVGAEIIYRQANGATALIERQKSGWFLIDLWRVAARGHAKEQAILYVTPKLRARVLSAVDALMAPLDD